MTATIGSISNGANQTTGGYGEPRDPNGTAQVANGGQFSVENLTTTQVVSLTATRLSTLVVLAGPGPLVLNDSASLAGATTANQVLNLTTTQISALTAANPVVRLDFPCTTGLTCSSIGAGTQVNLAINK